MGKSRFHRRGRFFPMVVRLEPTVTQDLGIILKPCCFMRFCKIPLQHDTFFFLRYDCHFWDTRVSGACYVHVTFCLVVSAVFAMVCSCNNVKHMPLGWKTGKACILWATSGSTTWQEFWFAYSPLYGTTIQVELVGWPHRWQEKVSSDLWRKWRFRISISKCIYTPWKYHRTCQGSHHQEKSAFKF